MIFNAITHPISKNDNATLTLTGARPSPLARLQTHRGGRHAALADGRLAHQRHLAARLPLERPAASRPAGQWQRGHRLEEPVLGAARPHQRAEHADRAREGKSP